MLKDTRRLAVPLALISTIMVGACRSEGAKSDTGLAADTSLSKQLAAAGGTTQPQLKDTAATTAAPGAAAPAGRREATRRTTTTRTTTTTTTRGGNTETRTAPGAASGGGAVGMIPAGSTLALNSTARVCTNTNKVGDEITATVAEAVTGSNGAVIPAGATVTLAITELKRSENANDPVVMHFQPKSVSFGGHTYAIDANVESANVERVRDEPKSKDVQKVAIGAAVGAIAGKILGKSTKATVIGGAAGAAAGAAAAAATANFQGCVPSGGRIVIKLNSATQVRV